MYINPKIDAFGNKISCGCCSNFYNFCTPGTVTRRRCSIVYNILWIPSTCMDFIALQLLDYVDPRPGIPCCLPDFKSDRMRHNLHLFSKMASSIAQSDNATRMINVNVVVSSTNPLEQKQPSSHAHANQTVLKSQILREWCMITYPHLRGCRKTAL